MEMLVTLVSRVVLVWGGLTNTLLILPEKISMGQTVMHLPHFMQTNSALTSCRLEEGATLRYGPRVRPGGDIWLKAVRRSEIRRATTGQAVLRTMTRTRAKHLRGACVLHKSSAGSLRQLQGKKTSWQAILRRHNRKMGPAEG